MQPLPVAPSLIDSIMRNLYIILVLIVISLTSFTVSKQEFCRRSGIRGHVFLVSGNQMPSPDIPASSGRGIQTTLYIYELTNINQTGRDGVSAFYKTINTKLIKEIHTDEKGAFKVKLKPGFYSLFVKKGDLYYANIYDDKNNIYPVEVKKGGWSDIDFRADYDAVY